MKKELKENRNGFLNVTKGISNEKTTEKKEKTKSSQIFVAQTTENRKIDRRTKTQKSVREIDERNLNKNKKNRCNQNFRFLYLCYN